LVSLNTKVAAAAASVGPRRYAALLGDYLAPQWPRAALLAVLVAAGVGLQLVGPQLLRTLIDAARSGSTGATEAELVRTALLFLGAAVLQQAASVAAAYVGAAVGWTATNRLRADLLAHCLDLDLSFHNARTPGEMIERVDTDVSTLANFFSQFGVRLVSGALLLAGVLVLLSREDWRLGVAFTAFAMLAVAVLRRVPAAAAGRWREARQRGAELFGGISEFLDGAEDLRTCGAVDYARGRFFGRSRALMRADRAAFMASSLLWIAPIGVFAVGQALAVALGGYLLASGAITLGTVFLIFSYADLLRRPIDQINTQLQDLQRAAGSIVRLDELLHTASAIHAGSEAPLAGPPTVEFDRVTFVYPGSGTQALRDASFRLEPGRVLGLLGRTGSGKSTVARLLFRFHDATGGAVRLNGVDVREARLKELRARIGLVTQEVQLFHASVRDNLTFFRDDVPDERIAQVLEDLGLGGWLGSLPNGLNTELAPRGGGLSAGEAQLLALARVFLKDPDLVVLDEASSRLDPATERLVEPVLDRLLAGRTAVIIAHRLATVSRADHIVLLEDGRVREQGPYDALASDPHSRFAALLRARVHDLDAADAAEVLAAPAAGAGGAAAP
jgi:ATP-binding cassette subfamily B protein